MALGADLTAQPPPVRIPKLKYRNPLPIDEKSPLQESRRDSANSYNSQDPPATPSSKAPSSEAPSSKAPSSKAPSSEYRPSFETASLTSPSLASTASSASSSNDSKSSKKKKTGSVLGFFSLKEPSQDALKQYADAQRKQTVEKGASTLLSRPGSSYASKKLPGNIPKVNSKWDGVPESIKHRHARSSGSSKDRHSVSSQDSKSSQFTALSRNSSKLSAMTDGTHNPPNSVASAASSLSNFAVNENARSSSPLPSTTTLPEISYYFPEPLVSGALPVETSQPMTYHPSTTEAPPRLSKSSTDFDFQSDQLSDVRSDSPNSSTGSVDTIVRDTADVIFKKLNGHPQESFWGDAPAVQLLDEDNQTSVPDSHDFLFSGHSLPETLKADLPMTTLPVRHYAPARQVHNFSRPISSNNNTSPARLVTTPSYRTTPISSGLPTLYEASLASTESEETVQDGQDMDSYSIAPSTVAPSELSAHWHDSPRERLGLGGHLRMNNVLPWESQREPLGKLKKYRLSMFGKATSRT